MNRRAENYLIIIAVFSLALMSRLYRLNDFPYFLQPYPWSGEGSGELKGLYTDEYWYQLYAQDLMSNPLSPPIYQPWLQLLAIGASMLTFGSSPFAIRLPSAVFSAVSIVLVYLICESKFKSRLAAGLSSLYLTAMTPALILNRMAFLENGAVMFFLASYYTLLFHSEQKGAKWVMLSAVFAGLSVLCKINGLVAPLFLILYLTYNKSLTKNLKPIIAAFALIATFPIIVLAAYRLSPIELVNQFLKQWGIEATGREFALWQYLTLNAMPSGYLVKFNPMSTIYPEYWHIFGYFALAYLALTEFDKASDITLAVGSFIALFLVFLPGIAVYYNILIQPFLAIPVGYALDRLRNMSVGTAIFFYLFLYTPVTLAFDFYLAITPELNLLKFLTLAFPLIPLFLSSTTRRFHIEFPNPMNSLLLTLFFIFLLLGSYVFPIFYPHYFLGIGR